jgi:hypothetical protein
MKRSVLFLPLLLLAGCQGPSFVGTWTSEVDMNVSKVPVTLTVKQDGTWTGTMKTKGISTPMMQIPAMTATADGAWKVDGDSLTWTGSNATVTDAPPIVMPFKSKVEEEVKTGINRWNTAKIKFPDAKTAELTLQSGDKVTLTRVTAS